MIQFLSFHCRKCFVQIELVGLRLQKIEFHRLTLKDFRNYRHTALTKTQLHLRFHLHTRPRIINPHHHLNDPHFYPFKLYPHRFFILHFFLSSLSMF